MWAMIQKLRMRESDMRKDAKYVADSPYGQHVKMILAFSRRVFVVSKDFRGSAWGGDLELGRVEED